VSCRRNTVTEHERTVGAKQYYTDDLLWTLGILRSRVFPELRRYYLSLIPFPYLISSQKCNPCLHILLNSRSCMGNYTHCCGLTTSPGGLHPEERRTVEAVGGGRRTRHCRRRGGGDGWVREHSQARRKEYWSSLQPMSQCVSIFQYHNC